MSTKIHFRAQEEEEMKKDPEVKSLSKSVENIEDYALD